MYTISYCIISYIIYVSMMLYYTIYIITILGYIIWYYSLLYTLCVIISICIYTVYVMTCRAARPRRSRTCSQRQWRRTASSTLCSVRPCNRGSLCLPLNVWHAPDLANTQTTPAGRALRCARSQLGSRACQTTSSSRSTRLTWRRHFFAPNTRSSRCKRMSPVVVSDTETAHRSGSVLLNDMDTVR